MIRKAIAASLTALLLAGASVLMLTGCEDTPSDETVRDYFGANPYDGEDRSDAERRLLALSPSANIVLGPNQQVLFTVSGGKGPFSWSTGIPGFGTVKEASYDRQAIYTHLGTTNNINSVIVSDKDGRKGLAQIN